jgi:hypothetical protein
MVRSGFASLQKRCTVHPCRKVGIEKNKKYDIMAIISESSMRSDIGKDTSDFLEE